MMNGKKRCLIQISAGRGPVECELAVAKLRDRICEEALLSSIVVEQSDAIEGRQVCSLTSLILQLSGSDIESFVTPWLGTILWVCDSPCRPNIRRKNWYVGVNRIDEHRVVSEAIDPKALIWKTFKASGPGGQHVNKTDSAIQLTHRPSGIQVSVSDERSQHANKRIAKQRLVAQLQRLRVIQGAQMEKSKWQQHLTIERGRPVRIFYGAAFRERAKQ